jgi:hypothetical protein
MLTTVLNITRAKVPYCDTGGLGQVPTIQYSICSATQAAKSLPVQNIGKYWCLSQSKHIPYLCKKANGSGRIT